MTFEEAFDSYMTVSGKERSAAYQDKLMFRFFQQQFGRNVPIIDISPRLISRCLATLRGKLITRKGVRVPLTPATINRHTQFLQRVMNHTHDLNEPIQSIRWRAFIMVESEQHIHPLSKDDELFIINNIDHNILPLFQFSVLTGVRLKNAIELRWSMIDSDKGEITFRGKSRRPGGKTYVIPITKSVGELIRAQKGQHATYVFTFKAKRNDKHGHTRGQRYPLTIGVVRHYWETLGLGKRWHDVRHTFGTRLYEVSKDIHLVQRGLNHSNIATTMRYVHADRTDVRDAMEKLAELSPFRYINRNSGNEHNSFSYTKRENILKFQQKQRGAVGESRTRTGLTASTSRRRFKDWDKDHQD